MALPPWNPFVDFEELGEPDMDLYEKNNHLVVEFPLPELDPNKTEITVKNNLLKIKGTTEKKEESYLRREIKRGFFERVISLPVPVKTENVEATYEKGMLKIKMEKEEEKEDKQKIQIKIR